VRLEAVEHRQRALGQLDGPRLVAQTALGPRQRDPHLASLVGIQLAAAVELHQRHQRRPGLGPLGLRDEDPTAGLPWSLTTDEMGNLSTITVQDLVTGTQCQIFGSLWEDEFTGRTQEQEYGNGWAEGVHAEDFQRCMDTYMTAFVARKSFSMEYRLRRADGEYRWIYDQGVPRFTPDGPFAVVHAFPDGRSGTIGVELVQLAAGRLRLGVRDDGVGLPTELDPTRTTSLGLQIVVTMAEQLEADMQVERQGGATFQFTAHADDATIQRAKLTEPHGYLMKPITAAELRSAIEVSLYKHELEMRLRERERWFSTTLRAIADAVISVDLSGRVTSPTSVARCARRSPPRPTMSTIVRGSLRRSASYSWWRRRNRGSSRSSSTCS
jgi:PAS domain-containing protein